VGRRFARDLARRIRSTLTIQVRNPVEELRAELHERSYGLTSTGLTSTESKRYVLATKRGDLVVRSNQQPGAVGRPEHDVANPAEG